MQYVMYFKYVESEANWSDGISRNGFRDTWYQRHNLVPAELNVPTLVFDLDLQTLMRVLFSVNHWVGARLSPASLYHWVEAPAKFQLKFSGAPFWKGGLGLSSYR